MQGLTPQRPEGNGGDDADCRGLSVRSNLCVFQSGGGRLRPSRDLVLSLSFAGGVLLLIWLASAWWLGAFPFG
jgi:hypothetical protein